MGSQVRNWSGLQRFTPQHFEEPATKGQVVRAVEAARARSQRIRVRGKPLTTADIVPDGVYVPKRGNDKTPNIVVRAIDSRDETVLYTRDGAEIEPTRVAMTDFLALVSRRVSA